MIVLFPTLVTASPGSLIPRVSSLRIPAEPINFQTTPARDIHAIARALLQVMYSYEGGVGIAAPMIGFHLRLIAVHDRDSAPLILCNPRVTAASEVKVVGTEANLSIPGYLASIPRPEWIAYAAQDLGGNAVEGRADGFLARIILHELDVLDGLAFFDHIGEAPTRLPSASAKATDALSQALSSAVGNSIAGPSQAEGNWNQHSRNGQPGAFGRSGHRPPLERQRSELRGVV
jgi:peptide deformylase